MPQSLKEIKQTLSVQSFNSCYRRITLFMFFSNPSSTYPTPQSFLKKKKDLQTQIESTHVFTNLFVRPSAAADSSSFVLVNASHGAPVQPQPKDPLHLMRRFR